MKNKFRIVSGVVLAVAFAAMSASAAEKRWVGGTEGFEHEWNKDSNWNPSGVPTKTDVAIFEVGGDLAVTNTRSSDKDYNYFTAGIRVLSGNVSISSPKCWGISKSSCPTGEIYVAENATLTFPTYVGGGAKTDVSPYPAAIAKRGPGTVTFKGNVGYSSASGPWPYKPFILEEGLVVVATAGAGFYGDLIVRPGAEWRAMSYNIFGGNTGIVTVDKGGVVSFAGDGTQSMSGLQGSGDVKFTGDSGTVTLTLRMAGSDCAFSGTISSGIDVKIPTTATKSLVIGAPKSLEKVALSTSGSTLQFAPGIGEFWINSLIVTSSGAGVYPTEDTAGEPIVVHTTLPKSSVDVSASGSGDLAVAGTWDRSGGTFTVGKGVRMHGEKTTAMNANFTEFTCPRYQGVAADFSGNSSVLTIDGGEVVLGATDKNPDANTINIKNGGVLMPLRNMTAQSDKTMHVDDGTIRWAYDASANHDLGTDSYPWKVKVGAKGIRFDCGHYSAYSSTYKAGLYVATDTETGVETDGGAVFAIPGEITFCRAQNLKGPVSLVDGCITVSSKAYTAYPGGTATTVASPFGSGDLELGNIRFYLGSGDAAKVTPLAGGSGAKLILSGATRLALRTSSDSTPQSAVIGPADATACPIVRKNGGVLFLRELATDASFDGTHGTVKVNGGVPLDAAGRVKLPIFAVANTLEIASDEKRIDFTTYDGEKGLVCFTNYTDGVMGGPDSVALLDFQKEGATDVTLEEDAAVAALNVIGNFSANLKFTVPEGKTLTIGSGKAGEAGCVILKPSGQKSHAEIAGKGTLDFGESEAVFAIGRGNSYAYAPSIAPKIKAGGGVTYAGVMLDNVYYYVNAASDQDYTCDTFINAIQVRPKTSQAFGSGAVRVGDGVTCGGQVCFIKNVTMTNRFSIAGNGVEWASGKFAVSPEAGALWFYSAATLTGEVEVRGYARIGARRDPEQLVSGADAAGPGTFKGVVSGGRLQLMKSVQPIVFEAANTYTGGTEIVSSTLVLKGAGTAGTGTVTLDNGVLRFENTEPVVFTNALDGIGTIEVAGTSPVTFAGRGFDNLKFRTLAPGSTVDYPACTNATYVIGGEDFDIDLRGEDVTVAGISGSGTIRGGVMTVTGAISPAGAGAIGTVTFETAPVLTGATLVIETADGAVDKVVVPGDADISTLDLEIVQLGDIVAFKPGAIFSCGGDLTGEFASVAKPTQKGKNYTVEYTASAATLSYTTPGAIILVR